MVLISGMATGDGGMNSRMLRSFLAIIWSAGLVKVLHANFITALFGIVKPQIKKLHRGQGKRHESCGAWPLFST